MNRAFAVQRFLFGCSFLLTCLSRSRFSHRLIFVARAAKSKSDFIQATSELLQWAPSVTDGAQLVPYLAALDPLAVSAQTFGQDMTQLSATLTHRTSNFLRMNTDSEASIFHAFLKWGDDTDKMRMLGIQPLSLPGRRATKPPCLPGRRLRPGRRPGSRAWMRLRRR